MPDESPKSIGGYLFQMRAITRDELMRGLQAVAKSPAGSDRPTLGDTLIQLGLITSEDLREAKRRLDADTAAAADREAAERRATERNAELARLALQAHARDHQPEKVAGNHFLRREDIAQPRSTQPARSNRRAGRR